MQHSRMLVASVIGGLTLSVLTATSANAVCFYDNVNYSGSAICSSNNISSFGSMNDRASSVDITNASTGYAYEDAGFVGRNVYLGYDRANLNFSTGLPAGLNWNDRISSWLYF